MAAINGTMTPVFGPDHRPIIFDMGNELRCAFVKITIPAGGTYDATQAGRVTLASGANSAGANTALDFLGQYTIKQVMFSNGMSSSATAASEMKGEWIAADQRLQLRNIGIDATPTPLNDSELGAAVMAGVCNAEALVFF